MPTTVAVEIITANAATEAASCGTESSQLRLSHAGQKLGFTGGAGTATGMQNRFAAIGEKAATTAGPEPRGSPPSQFQASGAEKRLAPLACFAAHFFFFNPAHFFEKMCCHLA